MPSQPTSPLLMHNVMRIKDGHLDEFREAVRQAVAFVEEHGPQILVQVFIENDGTIAHSFQLYADSAAVLAHWKMSDPYIQQVMEHCTIERFEFYGEPDQEVRDGIPSSPLATWHTGFVKLPQVLAGEVS
jgi:quinol monooxygenase YgiN